MTSRVRSRALPRVALVTCRDWPVGDEDAAALQSACSAAGLDADWRIWDDPAVDWNSYDLAVIRSAWDYTSRRDDFVAWARTVPRLANPADVVCWNTDKTYLRELAAAGVPVVPTSWLDPASPDPATPDPDGPDPDGPDPNGPDPNGPDPNGPDPNGPDPDSTDPDSSDPDSPDAVQELRLPADREYVVKPAVSAGGRDTGRYAPQHAAQAREHAARLLAAGQRVMVQPYLTAVDEVGETALLYCGGRFSHAVRKGPLLTGPDAEVTGLFRPETVEPREPSPAELALGAAALAAVPGGEERLLYARVDLLPGRDGAPLLLELELTEPSFFLGASPGAADRFAAAVAAHVAASPTGASGR